MRKYHLNISNQRRKIMKNKKAWIGIVYAAVVAAVFIAISLLAMEWLSGTPWYLFSSLLRLSFGVLALMLMCRTYERRAAEILMPGQNKAALRAGAGFGIFFFYYLILYAVGFGQIAGLSFGIAVSRILLQQLTTGFYEELVFRGLVLEGYFHQDRKTWQVRLLYAAISFLLFGAIHVVTGWDLWRFLSTGMIGFAFAVIYLQSRNLILPMFLHFVYDIFANLAGYVQWKDTALFMNLNGCFEIMQIVMLAVSIVMLVTSTGKGKILEKSSM